MPIVYVDCVFFFNTLVDYFLFLVTARLAGVPLRRKRYLLAALLGGAYALLVFLPFESVGTAPLVKVSVGMLLVLVAYGNERQLFRLAGLWVLVSCGFAGCVLGLSLLLGEIPMVKGIFYTNINTKILAASFAAGYFLVAVVFRTAAQHGVRGTIVPTRIWMQEREVEFSSLHDTGNVLRDLESGRPVLVVAPGVLQCIFPRCIWAWISAEKLQDPIGILEPIRTLAPELRPQLIPYHSVGREQGLLLSVQVERAEIGGIVYPEPRIALSPTELGKGYRALWGGPVRERRKI